MFHSCRCVRSGRRRPIRPNPRIGPVLVLAIALRVAVPAAALLSTGDPLVFHDSDTEAYLSLAESLIRAGRFGDESSPDIVRTPGYPLVLVPGLLLRRPEAVTIGLQIALSLLTLGLVFRLTELVSRRRDLAWWAALLYAVEPLSIIYASKLLSETVFTTIVTATMYALAAYARRPTVALALTAAVGLAAAAYVRPIAYFMPIVVVACLLVVEIARRRPWRRVLGHAVLVVVVSMGLTGVWRVRNWVEAGYPGFAGISDVNLYFYLGASTRAARTGTSYYDMQREMGYYDPDLYLRLHPEQATWTPAQRLAYMGEEGRRTVWGAPLTYARIHLDGVVRTLIAPGATDALRFFALDAGLAGYLGAFVDQGVWRGVMRLFRDRPVVFWANLILAPLVLAYLVLAALGLGRRAARGEPTAIMTLAVVVYLLAIAGGPAAYARFRHPVMPLLCVYAACGLDVVRRRLGPATRAQVRTTARTAAAPATGRA